MWEEIAYIDENDPFSYYFKIDGFFFTNDGAVAYLELVKKWSKKKTHKYLLMLVDRRTNIEYLFENSAYRQARKAYYEWCQAHPSSSKYYKPEEN